MQCIRKYSGNRLKKMRTKTCFRSRCSPSPNAGFMLRNVNPWVTRIIHLLIGGNQWVYNGMTWLAVISHGWLRHMGMGQHLSCWCRGWNTLVTLVFTICSSWLLITTLFKTWAAKTIFLSINHLIIGGPQFTGQYECMLKFLFGVGNARCKIYRMLFLFVHDTVYPEKQSPRVYKDEDLVVFWCCYSWKHCDDHNVVSPNM